MIAGGIGGPTPASLTQDGVTELFAQNLLGHVVLLENLLAAGLLTDVAVLAGSEGARGIPKLRIARPTFTDHSSQEFASVIDGSFFQGGKFDVMLSYGQIKYLGALWMGAMARMHPELRFITMSPGNTAGTDVLRDQPAPVRIIASRILLPYVAACPSHRAQAGRWGRAIRQSRHGRVTAERRLLRKRRQDDHRTGHRPGRDPSRLPRP